MHLDTGGEDLDADLVHHQDSPVHLVGLLVMSQDMTQQSYQYSVNMYVDPLTEITEARLSDVTYCCPR